MFISFETPTKPMMHEAVSAGFYKPAEFAGRQFSMVQLLIIEELLGGKTAQYLLVAAAATFKAAMRKEKKAEPRLRNLL